MERTDYKCLIEIFPVYTQDHKIDKVIELKSYAQSN